MTPTSLVFLKPTRTFLLWGLCTCYFLTPEWSFSSIHVVLNQLPVCVHQSPFLITSLITQRPPSLSLYCFIVLHSTFYDFMLYICSWCACSHWNVSRTGTLVGCYSPSLLILGILEIKIKCISRSLCIRHNAKRFIRTQNFFSLTEPRALCQVQRMRIMRENASATASRCPWGSALQGEGASAPPGPAHGACSVEALGRAGSRRHFPVARSADWRRAQPEPGGAPAPASDGPRPCRCPAQIAGTAALHSGPGGPVRVSVSGLRRWVRVQQLGPPRPPQPPTPEPLRPGGTPCARLRSVPDGTRLEHLRAPLLRAAWSRFRGAPRSCPSFRESSLISWTGAVADPRSRPEPLDRGDLWDS